MRLVGGQKNTMLTKYCLMRTKIARISKFVQLMAISCQIVDMKNPRGQRLSGVDKNCQSSYICSANGYMRLVGGQKNTMLTKYCLMRTNIARVSKFVQLMAIFCQIVGHEESKGTKLAWCGQEIAQIAIFVQLRAISVQIVDMKYSAKQKWTR